VTGRRSLVLFVFVVVTFSFLAVRAELNQRGIEENNHRISVLFYNQCVSTNAANASWNFAIAEAVKTEKAKPKPNLARVKQIAALERPLADCGPKPRG
jgi:hypothetical protein